MFSWRNQKNQYFCTEKKHLIKSSNHQGDLNYHINHKYSDTIIPYHFYPNFDQIHSTICWCVEKLFGEWQTVWTLIYCHILWCLLWVYTVCSSLSVYIHSLNRVHLWNIRCILQHNPTRKWMSVHQFIWKSEVLTYRTYFIFVEVF